MATIPQSEIDYQFAHKDAYNAQGLNGFLIFGMCFCTLLVSMRLYSRRYLVATGWHADDATLVVALIITLASAVCFLIMTYNFGYGRHYLTLPVSQQRGFTKTDYAYNILYTVGYPLSKISLTLLYRRIFVLRWFNVCCWILIFMFAGYAISTAIVDIFLTIPINAYWNHDVTPRHQVDEVALYKANAWFNIVTDGILLIMPLTVLWRLQMTIFRRLGLTLVFAVGVLTVVATVMRLVLFSDVNVFDTSWTLTGLAYWTIGEQYLGVICPCLPTLRPFFDAGWERYSSRGSKSSTPQDKRSVEDPARWLDLQHRASEKDLRNPAPGAATDLQSKQAVIPSLDPRFTGPNMGNKSDVLYEEKTPERRDEESGLSPIPNNAICLKRGFQVEDE